MALSAVGVGTPFTSLAPPLGPWGLSPSIAMSANPWAGPQTYAPSPFSLMPTAGLNPAASLPLQQTVQLLQIVPQQLQHLLQLESLQQYQLQQLQQVLQLIPAQLAQLQQFIQFVVPQHIQQMQQPFGQIAGAVGIPGLNPVGIPGLNPWTVSSQLFGAQPSYVM